MPLEPHAKWTLADILTRPRILREVKPPKRDARQQSVAKVQLQAVQMLKLAVLDLMALLREIAAAPQIDTEAKLAKLDMLAARLKRSLRAIAGHERQPFHRNKDNDNER